ncbi:histidine phosphatase family protein [Clostridium sp.]|uniref:histidine phosphatase family protein n=1 Tax=Clostridium sp. TaxID=1506 RepID=UPI0032175948
MKNIYLIRHCKAFGQPAEAELTEIGIGQAIELKNYLLKYNINYIVSSPYVRAIKTITPFAEHLDLKINIDERVREKLLLPYGVEDYTPYLLAAYEDMDITFHGGESSNQATKRATEALTDILKLEEENVAIVTHGELFSLIMRYFDKVSGFDFWKNLSNPDVYLLRFESNDINSIIDIKRVWTD